MKLLEGKAAVVTGSGRGIGRAVAELFSAHGARVLVNDVDPDPAHETLEALRAQGGEAAAVYSASLVKVKGVWVVVKAELRLIS